MMSNDSGPFCGSPFWDQNQSWHSDIPDVTSCFQNTILSGLPSTLLLVLGPLELLVCARRTAGRVPYSVLNVLKVSVTLALICGVVTESVIVGLRGDSDVSAVVSPIVQIVGYLLYLILLHLSMRKAIRTSGVHLLFFFVDSVVKGIALRTVTNAKFNSTKGLGVSSLPPPIFNNYSGEPSTSSANSIHQDFVLAAFQLVSSVALILLNSFCDVAPPNHPSQRQSNPCPNQNASFLNNLFYFWFFHLIWKGFTKNLVTGDLWDLNPDLLSKKVVSVFDIALKKRYKKAEEKLSKIAVAVVKGTTEIPLCKITGRPTEKKHKEISMLPVIWKAFWPSFLSGTLMHLAWLILSVLTPQILKLMISFAESLANNSLNAQEKWKGVFYAVLLVISTTCQTLLNTHFAQRMYLTGMKVKSAVICAIYKKSLRMSAASRKESSVGEMVNLMSVDVQRFQEAFLYGNMAWSSPLQMIISIVFIYFELSHATLAGVGVLIIVQPLSGLVAKLMRKYQLEQMTHKDKRVKLMNEILGGMKILKLYAWEPSFIDQVMDIRNKEIKVLMKSAYFGAFLSFFWTCTPFLFLLSSFATFMFMPGGHKLTATKALVTLNYLNIMSFALTFLPMIIVYLVQANVSLQRLNKFMNSEELDEEAVSHNENLDKENAVVIEGGSFKWNEEESEVLEGINIKVKKGSLTAIVGSVGSGKSSVLSAMLGELRKESGRVNTVGKIGYVAQQAWIQNATLEDNILFGNDMDPKLYKQVIEACALKADLDILPGGDQTEIGEKGINLSGGQKQRVSLARAVYSKANLFLLDDPLSAVDSHVGKHIFNQVIGPKGLLNKTTRILVTHGITFLPQADNIIVMKDGRISEQGSYKELLSRKGDFADILLEYINIESDDEEKNDADVEDIKNLLQESLGNEYLKKQMSRLHAQRDSIRSTQSKNRKQSLMSVSRRDSVQSVQSNSRKQSIISNDRRSSLRSIKSKDNQQTGKHTGTQLIEKEKTETGSVKWSVYAYYMKAIGILGTIVALVSQAIVVSSNSMTNYWIAWWTNGTFGDPAQPKYRNMYLGVYAGIGIVSAIATVVLTAVLSFLTLTASGHLHRKMLERVIRSPMSFFDTTPLGRIVNRFSKDVDVCDNMLNWNFRMLLSSGMQFIVTVVIIMTILPYYFVFFIVPIALVFLGMQKVYVSTSRQLKRLESVTRSPIYSHFGESITGASTIRAFGLQRQFIDESELKVDSNQVCYFPMFMANRWLTVYLEMLCNAITFCVSMFVAFSDGSINPSEVGLVITYAQTISMILNQLVRAWSDIETNMVGVERIKEYSDLEQESSWITHNSRPHQTWPAHGDIEFVNYSMRYRKGLDLVIKNISCQIKGGQKVGIVGRTGAGKSSLTMALFRLVEQAEGSIWIDGEDISTIGLHDLRNKLTIIPQDPVLFSGTLRLNLDPFSKYADHQLWQAIEQAHLRDYTEGLEAGLEHEVSEGGENLSVGQRQLVCLARALLRKTKLLVLDEATAAVDLETDELIQATIRKEFADCTVLTIAHRINTIMDYDRIVVLEEGTIREFDSPANLIKNSSTIFFGMAKDAGLVVDI